MSWLIQAIQAATNAKSVSTYSLIHGESDISISYHHWNLHSVLKPSPTSFKSQDTLNIFRRTRGYPSVLRKVWQILLQFSVVEVLLFLKKKCFNGQHSATYCLTLSRKKIAGFPFQEFKPDFRLLRVWDKSLSDQDAANTFLSSFCN